VFDLGWNEQKRVRRSVQHRATHLGYVTTVAYPDRDLAALTEGSPYSEVVIADPHEAHVSLLQRYKAHWLIQCGDHYDITARGGELTDDQVMRLAQAVLLLRGKSARTLVDGLKELIEGLLPETSRK
jgi:hypothetical protein